SKWLLIILFALWGGAVFAQTSTVSNPTNGRENNPYSKYGIGEFLNGNNTVLRGMGNITSAYSNPYQVNADNPASYAFLQRTTFEIGATGSASTVNASGLTYKTGTAGISYINLGIPLNKNGGLCLGFRPYTRVYYSMVDTINANSNPPSPIGKVVDNYDGEGGLNYAYIGAAAKYKGFSIGFNFGYMFGTIRHTTATIPIDTLPTNRAYTAEFTNYTRIGGIYWKGGAMYEHRIDSDYTIHIGGTLTVSQNITEHLDAFQISSYYLGDTMIHDTVSNPGEQRGRLRLPLSYSIGVILSKNDKWNIGIDYTATQWSGFKSTPDASLLVGVGQGSYKISVGGSYTPDAGSIRNYFSRVTYRFGLYYGTDYLNLYNTALPVYGVTAGGTLPFRRSTSGLHMAFDIGRLGTSTNNLIQETYVRFTLGISLNDRWFIPRKYD
ncbi:MAG: hypothetical protein ACHQD8_06660, partial [Chitinophagales bacterium]